MEPTPLARLEQGLAQAEAAHPIELKTTQELQQWVKTQQGRYRLGSSHFEPIDRQRETIVKFKNHRHLSTLKEARWLAFGLSLPLSNAPCLMEDPDWFDLALQQISAWQNEPRRFKKCYQGLLHSYFSYDGKGWLTGSKTSEVGQANWQRLQGYLQKHLHLLQSPQENWPQAEWVDCLLKNPGLLSDQAGLALAAPDAKLTPAQAIKILAIPRGSWYSKVWALTPLHKALMLSDEDFVQRLPELIKLMEDHPELHDAALTAVLDRCSAVTQSTQPMPPHTGLREHCARHWGNPWLSTHQTQWRHIRPIALNLLKDWFKLELIELFFQQLSEDQAMRQRKMVFWQTHFRRIDSLHLALGPLAMNSKEPVWVQLRQKTLGFTVDMLDINPRNNALIMAIDGHMAIELSGTSDDFCHYQFAPSSSTSGPLPHRAQEPGGFSSKALRESEQVTWLAHQDETPVDGKVQTWENRVEALLASWKPV
jgi:hypothetical protein